MQRKSYFQTVVKRQNAIKEFLAGVFLAFASWPRLVLEVFIRKNMGERYFSLSTAVIISMVMWTAPYYLALLLPFADGSGMYTISVGTFWQFVWQHWLYYLFIPTFLYMAYQRHKEIKRLPSVFDFERYTRGRGDINPFFLRFSFFGIYPDARILSCIIEPACVFLVGMLISFIEPLLGKFLMDCAFFYSMSYFAAYHDGDNYMMDIIDEIIINEELTNVIVEGRGGSSTRGFDYTGRKPSDPDNGRRVVNMMRGGDDDDFADAV